MKTRQMVIPARNLLLRATKRTMGASANAAQWAPHPCIRAAATAEAVSERRH